MTDLLTKEQEAQQAQTIERWSHSGYEEMTPYDDGVYVLYDDHKAIVDSQAQKIAEQAKEIERLKIVKTEQQMCDAYDDIYGPVKSVADRKQYMAWMECARFLAVIPK